MSEADIFKNIWSPILDIVFEGSSIVLRTSSPAAPKSITNYDIPNCEVAKDGKAEKSSTDNGKLLVEGKMILH
ncbi:hypothetical protein HPULCUR_003878 [Helicostylum pulchrum]|uniref:Uncharacterized protein n=1 Tax=Helicostylum pulchrum TaxID=562976 RepID=A0ABP9XUM1_9FUNG